MRGSHRDPFNQSAPRLSPRLSGFDAHLPRTPFRASRHGSRTDPVERSNSPAPSFASPSAAASPFHLRFPACFPSCACSQRPLRFAFTGLPLASPLRVSRQALRLSFRSASGSASTWSSFALPPVISNEVGDSYRPWDSNAREIFNYFFVNFARGGCPQLVSDRYPQPGKESSPMSE